jgi:hypothetical protein
LIDLLLSYRAVSAWADMVTLSERMPPTVKQAVLVREQLAFALNRLGRRDEALRILDEVEQQRGPSSETCGLIGRVYKDQWDEARAAKKPGADGFLRKAIAAYVRGFESDFRDAYPGINAVTLLDIAATDAAKQAELLPVVEFAVKRRLAGGKPDYWDRATLLELAVLRSDPARVDETLGDAVAMPADAWMRTSTGNNLTLIRNSRVARGQFQQWLDDAIVALDPELAKKFVGP